MSANSAVGQTFATNGWGLAASLEAGYPIALGHSLTIAPQAQAVFERISLHGGQDAHGLIDFSAAESDSRAMRRRRQRRCALLRLLAATAIMMIDPVSMSLT